MYLHIYKNQINFYFHRHKNLKKNKIKTTIPNPIVRLLQDLYKQITITENSCITRY